MSANTPIQGFPYPLASDRPCDYPVTMAALANALDTKSQSFDTDVARLAKRKWVKVSRTAFNYDSNDMLFDTVENNNGTPTDLTLDPFRIQLAPGFYVIQGKIVVPTNVANGNYYARIKKSGGSITFSAADTTARDYGSSTTPTTIGLTDACYVPSGIGKATLTMTYTGGGLTIPITYASLSAWWISDA